MHLSKVVLCFSLILKCVIQVNSLVDPMSLAMIGTAIGAISYIFNNPVMKEKSTKFAKKMIKRTCQMVGYCEGCEDYWIPANLKGLEYELRSQVFGQPLAIELVLSALKNHLSKKNPDKALVLSFHGTVGTGKNFISKKILKNMFKLGEDTTYAKLFQGSIDFPSRDKVEKYKEILAKNITEAIYECHRSIFVFDEVEKMPDGVLDVISGFVQVGKRNEYDYRRAIFILLSNVGSGELTFEALVNWKRGIRRENMDPKDLMMLLAKASYNSNGGLHGTGLVKNHDISYFVPFLPLERHHIVQCLENYIVNVRNQIMSPELTELVLEGMVFGPEPELVFSTSGCKRVEEVAAYQLERVLRMNRKQNLT